MKKLFKKLGEALLFMIFITVIMIWIWFFISIFDISAHNTSPGGVLWLGDWNLFSLMLGWCE